MKRPLCAAALFLLCAFSAFARADVLVSSWGGGADGGGKIERFSESTGAYLGVFHDTGLSANEGLAYGPDGKVYVTEWNAKDVKRYLPDGTYDGVFCSGLSGNVYNIAFDTAGNAYVLAGADRLYKFGPDGTARGTVGVGWVSGPEAVRQGPDGYLYVSNYSASNVVRFLPDGTNASVVCTVSERPGGMDIAANGDIYLVSYAGSHVFRWSPGGGTAATRIATLPAANADSCALDRQGNLNISTNDYSNNVYRLHPNGTIDTITTGMTVAAWVATPFSCAPSAVFVGGDDGAVHAYDSFGHDLGVFIPSGTGGLTGVIYGMKYGPDGSLYISAGGNGQVKRFNGRTGEFLSDFGSGMIGPYDVEVDGAGNVYAAGRALIQRFRADGLNTANYSLNGDCAGLWFLPDGRLLFANTSGTAQGSVGALDVTSGTSSVFSPDVGGRPGGITKGPDGRYYIVAYPDSIRVVGASGGSASTFASSGSQTFYYPSFCDGKLFVTGYFSKTIGTFDSVTGAQVDVFSTSYGPGGIVTRPWGSGAAPDLFVASYSNRRVDEFDVLGNTVRQFVTQNTGSRPQGIRFGPDGNLYVCRYDGGGVEVYDGGTGQFLRQFCAPAHPVNIVFDAAGNAFVSTASDVQKFDPNGTFVRRYTDSLSLPDAIDLLPDGRLLVANAAGTNSLVAINPDTGATTVFATGLPGPVGMTPDPRGGYFLACPPIHGVVHVNLDGTWARFDTGTSMSDPEYLIVSNGVLYVTDDSANTVWELNAVTGALMGSFAAAQPSGITVQKGRSGGGTPVPFDLVLTDSDLAFAPDSPVVSGSQVTISATVRNDSDFDGSATVRFYQDQIGADHLIGEKTAVAVGKHSTTTTSVTWDTTGLDGSFTVIARVEDASPAESSTTNNTGARTNFKVQKFSDLQVSAGSAPAEVWGDRSFDVSWTDANKGAGTAHGPWNDRVYFSSQDHLTGSETLLGEFPLGLDLAPNATADRIQTVTIPRSAVPSEGPYYLLVVTDSGNAVPESNENNNVRAIPISVRLIPLPDLTVTSIVAPNTALFDQTITVKWTVKNLGPGSTDAGSWNDRLYLSSDATPRTDAYWQLDVENFSYLNSGESYTAQADVKIPRGIVGTYYVVVKTDNGNAVVEGNETNNFTNKPITISAPPLPDLQVPTVQTTSSGFAGQSLLVNWTVKNGGDGKTPPDQVNWTDSVYISKSATWNPAQATLVGTNAHSGQMLPGDTYSVQNFSVTLPDSAIGDWYVYVFTDSSNQVYEFVHEDNNVGRSSVSHFTGTPPDLVVSIDQAPAAVEGGKAFDMKFTVTNLAAFDAKPGWWDTVYLSTSATFDPSTAQALGSFYRDTLLAAGASYQRTATFTLPLCTKGSFYLFVFTDSRKQVFEYAADHDAEANNVSDAKAVTVTSNPPDLQVSSVTNDASGEAGKKIAVSWTVTNGGPGSTANGSAGAWNDTIYLSGKSTFDGSAVSLGSVSHTGDLDPGGSYTVNGSLTIPATLVTGTYYLFVKTDSGNSVNECDHEDNNVGSSSVTVNVTNNTPPAQKPDLSIQSIDAPAQASVGDLILVQWAGKNAGPGDANTAWRDYIYINTTGSLDGNERLVASKVVVGPVPAGQSYNAQASFVVPAVPSTGSYFLIVKADGNNSVDEADESNNTSAVSIAVKVPDNDLQVTALDAPSDAVAGQSLTVSWTVKNNGADTTAGGAWTDYVILSHDQILDPTDKIVGFLPHSGKLDGGATYNAHVDVTIPQGITGPYYLFVYTDWNNQLAESNELNNTGGPAPVNVTLPPPVDLTPTAVLFPSTGNPGEPTTLRWTVKNAGKNAAIGRWTDVVYLSATPTWTVDAVPVARMDYDSSSSGPLAAGASYTQQFAGDLPPVNPGAYYLIVRTDVRNKIREDDETNNSLTSGGTMAVDVYQLTLGEPFNTTLSPNKERFQKVNVPSGETLLYSLHAGDPNAGTELYARYGAIASRAAYDFQFGRPWEPDQEVVVPDTLSGFYYSLIRGAYMPSGVTPVTLTAQTLPFQIRSFSPARMGDFGQVTVTLKGARFTANTQVRLVGDSATLTPAKVWAVDGATLKARFYFTGSTRPPHGNYTVYAADHGATVAAAVPIAVETATLLQVHLSTNGNLLPRVGRVFETFGSVKNTGNVDDPYVMVTNAFTGSVKMTFRRPAGTLPRPSDFPDYDWSTNSPTARTSAGGVTTDSFVIRGIEPGQEVFFSAVVTDFARGPFKTTFRAMPYDRGDFATRLRNDSEHVRQACIADPSIPLTPEETAALNSADAWWQIQRQILIATGWIDGDEPGVLGKQDGGDCEDKFAECVSSADDDLKACRQRVDNIVRGIPNETIRDFVRRQGYKICDSAHSITITLCELNRDLCKLQHLFDDNCDPNSSGVWHGLSSLLVSNAYGAEINGCGSGQRATDPNGVNGPVGAVPSGMVQSQQPWPYTIEFENVPTATAATQRITITTQLDPNLDPRTFRLKSIGFGKYRFDAPDNRAFYQTRVQLGDDLGGLLCDISGGLDITTNTINWTLTAIDPVSGEQPSSALLGLLPPNNDLGVGQGFVSYSILPKKGVASGSVIGAAATITFDANEPLITNTFTSTVDGAPPVSAVKPLPASSPATFNVSWAGTDDASGIRFFTIWVKDNDGPYQPLLTDTTLTSAAFTGVSGHTYQFYSIATDNAGNVELSKSAPDAITAVGVTGTTLSAANVTGYPGQAVTLSATLKRADGVALSGKTVAFTVGGASAGSATTGSSGVATKSYTIPSGSTVPGSAQIAAAFAGDATYTVASATATLSIRAKTTLTVANASGNVNATVTLKATLKSGSSVVAGAMVRFKVDGVAIGTVNTDSTGIALLSHVITEAAGAHALTAEYDGDANYAPAVSPNGTLTAKALATTLVVASVTAAPNANCTLKATLKAGTVLLGNRSLEFFVDGASVGSAVTNSSGVATLAHTASEPAGTHALTVKFAGDSVYAASTGSGTLKVKKIDTKTTPSAAAGKVGATITLKATVKAGSTPIVGATVHFLVDSVAVGDGTADAAGLATHSFKVPEGVGATHTVTATYDGDATYAASTGSAALTIQQASTKITGDAVKAKAGTAATFGAKLVRTTDLATLAGKTLNFYDAAGNLLGSGVTDSSGRATISVMAPAAGVKMAITIKFGGDTNYVGASGAGSVTGT